jgi:hypothetical protein
MMKPAVIFSIPMTTTTGYCWRWRAVDGKNDSADSFVYYYDCVTNARANGYDVEPTRARGDKAPGHAALGPHPQRIEPSA